MSERRTTANDELSAIVAARVGRSAPVQNGDLSWPCLLLRVGRHWFGLRAESVREVVVPQAITPVPAQPAHVLGVALVHGRLVPVVDISKMVTSMDVTIENAKGRRLAVIAAGEAEIGIIADEAKGVIDLPVPERKAADSGRGTLVLGQVRWDAALVSLFDVTTLVELAMGLE